MGKQKAKRRQRNRTLSFLLGAMILLLLIGLIVALGVPVSSDSLVAAKPTRRAISPRDGICDPTTMQTMIDTYAEAEIPLIFTCSEDIELLTGLNIRGDVTIIGQPESENASLVTIDGKQYAERLFYLEKDASLTLISLHITNSRRFGIYLTPGSILTTDHVTISDIASDAESGYPIYNEGGSVIMNSSRIRTYGVAMVNFGDVWFSDDMFNQIGGCIASDPTSTVTAFFYICEIP
ncbi:MAG: hypothetical protein KC546_15280 [Anaerolineae bacterium]|nr:hypothetical protein [Anaerolineae bacterium]